MSPPGPPFRSDPFSGPSRPDTHPQAPERRTREALTQTHLHKDRVGVGGTNPQPLSDRPKPQAVKHCGGNPRRLSFTPTLWRRIPPWIPHTAPCTYSVGRPCSVHRPVALRLIRQFGSVGTAPLRRLPFPSRFGISRNHPPHGAGGIVV